jgi:hypothetical protein
MVRSLSLAALFALSFSFSSTGCGGSSTPGGPPAHGVAPTRLVTSLTAEEIEKVCADSVARLGGENHTVQCGKHREFKTNTVDECKSSLGGVAKAKQCALTVGELDACTAAQAKDVCADHVECNDLIAKSFSCR